MEISRSLALYEGVVGAPVIRQLRCLGEKLAGLKVVHVNSTREGGGVAEILEWMVPLMRDLGFDASWQVLQGTRPFFEVTKSMHNALQGKTVRISTKEWDVYQKTNARNVARLRHILENADIVVIHDPQPAALLEYFPKRRGKWIWRAHIDISHPYRQVWKQLRHVIEGYDASIFHMRQFAHPLPHPQFIIPPSIDPLSDKNCDLSCEELEIVRNKYGLDRDHSLLVQVSRFDRFKDPLGVIEAYRMVRRVLPVQLVLAGGGATDDPEGKSVLYDVIDAAKGDPDIHVLLLPPNSHRTINALQRLADIVIQKSIREGFGLVVTEGLWKGKPVIGGDVGGIRLQVVNHQTGFLVDTPEGAAHRIRFLLHHRHRLADMGETERKFVLENYLLTRHLREYMTLFFYLRFGSNGQTIFI